MDANDIIEVHQLLGLYGHVLDAAEWDRLDELFETDAVLDYTGVRAPRVFSGIEEIREFFRDANHPSAHHVTNIVVFEADGEVRVKSKFFAPYTRPDARPAALVRRRLRRRRRPHTGRLALPQTGVHRPLAARARRAGAARPSTAARGS